MTLEKGNPNRDTSTGRFTFGSGGSGAGAGGAGGSNASGENAGSAGGASGGGGSVSDPVEGKDITAELGEEYGTKFETDKAKDLRNEGIEQPYDPVLKDIAQKQGFDGKAELVSQEEFDKVVADGGTVTHRGISGYWEEKGPSADFVEGDKIETKFAEGDYFAGKGGYGSGTYTTSDQKVAEHYATEGKEGGAVVTMAIKPGAKIATPQQWQAAREAARNGTGGFMGADNEGIILAAQGFDGFRIASKNVDHFSNEFTVILNRTAVVVLDK